MVVGNGMVGLNFIEKLVKADTEGAYQIVAFAEENRPAYHRMNMTQYFEHRDASKLELASSEWYVDSGVELHVGDRVTGIDRDRQVVHSANGEEIAYDKLVIATGSTAFFPPIPGTFPGVETDTAVETSPLQPNLTTGVFGYRTLKDLDDIIEYAGAGAKRCAVLGGGLLGLEAAKAAYDLGCEVHVVEFASRLMPRQVDDEGSKLLVQKIEDLGLKVHLGTSTEHFVKSQDGAICGIKFKGVEEALDVDMIIVSCGIKPRDDLARACGLELGPRGGVKVDASLASSDPNIYAIGEAACLDHSMYGTMIYGLVAPGYDMAEVVAQNLMGGDRAFPEADMSTKLKLMGVDVASFGDTEVKDGETVAIVKNDPIAGVYKKLVFSADGTRLVGGILVGDAADYQVLLGMSKVDAPLGVSASDLVYGASGDGAGGATGDAYALPDDFQVCSCNNVTKGDILSAIREGELTTAGQVKNCTTAGTGCGGCMPLVTELFNKEMLASGKDINKTLCEHLPFTRQELYHICAAESITTFEDLLARHGSGCGCEVCKPAVASILASQNSEFVLKEEHLHLQDSNDRYLANIQRGGSYSVVPRIPGGEITPQKLRVLGEVGEKYGLYTKITGGQRIDLFGAEKGDLPAIWEELVHAGFESGHAYAKALRTVKSCVGSTWCRYGLQDSVGFAVRVEERYRGIRAPHKLKSGVSGCVRECAEAQCKDFGLIATEVGYNIYVCGNGGAKPVHGKLLATDKSEAECFAILDRFLMFYIRTAGPLTRTARWLEEMEGGFDYLRAVVLDDSLGIGASLEAEMEKLVGNYKCEWAEVVNDPAARAKFVQFANEPDVKEQGIDFVDVRGQLRPADWPKTVSPPSEEIAAPLRALPALLADAVASNGSIPRHSTPIKLTADEHNVEISNVSEVAAAEAGLTGGTLQWSSVAWVRLLSVKDVPKNSGANAKYGKTQITVYNFAARGEWYASHAMCPHKNSFVMNQGLLGEAGGVAKVACPMHKKPFALESGECLSGDDYQLPTFPVSVDGDDVYVLLPPTWELDLVLATDLYKIGGGIGHSCGSADAPTTAV